HLFAPYLASHAQRPDRESRPHVLAAQVERVEGRQHVGRLAGTNRLPQGAARVLEQVLDGRDLPGARDEGLHSGGSHSSSSCLLRHTVTWQPASSMRACSRNCALRASGSTPLVSTNTG